MAKRSFICFLFLSTVLNSRLAAQQFYVGTSSDLLLKVTMSTAGCTSAPLSNCIASSFSIALYKDTLYFNRHNSLYRAIQQSNGFVNCTEVCPAPGGANALTVDSSGILYCAVGSQLHQINPHTGNRVFLGNMPFISAGDMVFYNHTLYLASTAGIVEVNTAAPDKSILVIPFTSRSMYGLATLAIDCNRNGIYGFVSTGGGTELVEIDIQNKRIGAAVCTLPYTVFDAASVVESGGFIGIKIKDITVKAQCDNPGKAYVKINTETGVLPYTYTLNNAVQNTTGIFQNLNAGTYQLKITTTAGCDKDTVFTVPAFNWAPASFLAFQNEPTCAQPGKIWFTASPSSGPYRVVYQKDTFSLNNTFSNLTYGEHKFHFTNTYGCLLDSAAVDFVPKESCDTIYFPSAFTPNNDGRNDVFRGSYHSTLKRYKLQVYTRWGERIFSTTDQQKGWNGFFKEAVQPGGVYVWMATYLTAQGRLKIQKGTVALIR